MFLTKLSNGNSLNILHDEIGKSVVSHSTVEKSCDARMFQGCQYIPLLFEAFNILLSSPSFPNYFNSHLVFEGAVCALCKVNGSHAAPAYFFPNGVGPNRTAN